MNFSLKKIYKKIVRSIIKNIFLLNLIILLLTSGILILYSASHQNYHLILNQLIKIFFSFIIMLIISIIHPNKLKSLSPYIYILGITLLIIVIFFGIKKNGAKRWINLKLFQFQPSEIMKIATPMMLTWYIDNRYNKSTTILNIFLIKIIILIPTILIFKEPDLGTAMIIFIPNFSIFFLIKISKKKILLVLLLPTLLIPIIWKSMYNYQKQRLTSLLFFNNHKNNKFYYHNIQSQIAIGSGGLLGKGWLKGTQSYLNFLPERTTDFIFAVSCEEFGLFGGESIIILITLISIQSIYISKKNCNNYCKLLGTIITINFFTSYSINIGMVIGIFPITGVPLPLISYGGTSITMSLISFGILMSINFHQTLFSNI
ncbi:rod shape-determining protein RodA [Candidatus Legionella polyplacis]|uniref:Cell wall polymerase n=1 Tax=Candidatus Legionella polyplacis TaxID=2005262 RepID=A0ABZ2GVQ7_9GAMM|nr:rod shape-determining protein RodA [Candidatus Legionella polyplacis]ATW02056.1 rod shape-determining protein RodA [Candidatus Legionella polyplacis]